jgi:dihydrofolate reductase
VARRARLATGPDVVLAGRMTKVIADISVSLDGFVTGPDPGLLNGLGDGGEPLHTWAIDSDDPVDAEILRSTAERSGAVVMGRKLFDIIDGPGGWNDEVGYGAREAATPPFFVVTHQPPASRRLTALDFTFVTDGVAAAVEQARAAAGGKDVVIMGGGDVVRQVLEARLADELNLHLSPIVLGAGTPLFGGAPRIELRQTSSVASKHATHLTYSLR